MDLSSDDIKTENLDERELRSALYKISDILYLLAINKKFLTSPYLKFESIRSK